MTKILNVTVAALVLMFHFEEQALADSADDLVGQTINVAVNGAVKDKGRYMLSKQSCLTDAIDIAGGATIYATGIVRLVEGQHVEIFRMKKMQAEQTKGPVLQDGAVIQVDELCGM